MKILLPKQIETCLIPSSYKTIGYKETEDLLNYKDEFDCIVTYPIDGAKLSLIEHFSKAKEFIVLGSGKENIDYETAKDKGINVISLEGVNEYAVVEWLIFHYLLYKRQLDVYGTITKPTLNFLKERYSQTIPVITGLGFIGFGNIANRFLQSIELVHTQVYYFDPYVTKDIGIKVNSINEIFKNCSVIIVSVPFVKETTNLIDSNSLKDVSHKIALLSISRYEVINWESLIPYKNRFNFIALDCLPDEYLMLKKNTKINNNLAVFEIAKTTPVAITPHIAGRTFETNLKIATELNGHFLGKWNAKNFPKVQDYIKNLSIIELHNLNEQLYNKTKTKSILNARDEARIKLEGIINEQTKLSTYKTKNIK